MTLATYRITVQGKYFVFESNGGGWERSESESLTDSHRASEKVAQSLVDLHAYAPSRLGLKQIKLEALDHGGEARYLFTSPPLDGPQQKELLDWFVGQCSDGWGECFEQSPYHQYSGYKYEYALHYSPWGANGKIEAIGTDAPK